LVLPDVGLHSVPAEDDDLVLVLAVTRDVAARAHLARQLSGGSVLLLFPDYSTVAQTIGNGLLSAHLDQPGEAAQVISCGGLAVDRLRQEVTWYGTPLRLTRLEREMLACLADPPIRVWTYERLFQAVWREAWLGDASILHASAKRLRRKLRDAGVAAALESVRGVGFRLLIEAGTGADGSAPVGSSAG
jgi:two-component system, OmpR family, response regulator MtrA